MSEINGLVAIEEGEIYGKKVFLIGKNIFTNETGDVMFHRCSKEMRYYTWRPRVGYPRECPKCKKRINYNEDIENKHNGIKE